MGGVKAVSVMVPVGIGSVEAANCCGCWISAAAVGVEGCGYAAQHDGALWSGALCLGQWSQVACLCWEAWRHGAELRDTVSREMMATMICSVRFILAPLDVADCELMLRAEEFFCERLVLRRWH